MTPLATGFDWGVFLVWAIVAFFAVTGLASVAFCFLMAASHKRERVLWEQMSDRVLAAWRESTERTTNILQTGTPTKPEAVVSPPEPDAEERVLRMVQEETIQNGMARLRELYAASGIAVSDEDLRAEAMLMLAGHSPAPPLTYVRD